MPRNILAPDKRPLKPKALASSLQKPQMFNHLASGMNVCAETAVLHLGLGLVSCEYINAPVGKDFGCGTVR